MNVTHGLDTIERAVADIAAGKAVVVVDDEDRENEGDLVFAAELATPELMSFMIRYSSGYVCVPMTAQALDRLELPLMVERMATPGEGPGVTTPDIPVGGND